MLATIFAHHLLPSFPMPLGGPNVMLGALTVLSAIVWTALEALPHRSRTGCMTFLTKKFNSLLPVMATALLLLLWAFSVELLAGNLGPERLAKAALGIGILFAVYLTVNSVKRAVLMATAFICAIFASALFGLTVAYMGGIFLETWVQIADVWTKDLHSLLFANRLMGATAHAAAFSYQLAVAVPLAFAAVLHDAGGENRVVRVKYRALIFLMLMTMATALLINGSRASLLSVSLGILIISLISLKMPAAYKRLPAIFALIAIWMLALFNPAFAVKDLAATLSELVGSDRQAAVNWTVADNESYLDPAMPSIEGLAFGLDAYINGDGTSIIVLPIPAARLPLGGEYAVQMRSLGPRGYGDSSRIVALPEDDGNFMLTWETPENPNVISYQWRLRAVDETQWEAWNNYFPPYVYQRIDTLDASYLEPLLSSREWAINERIVDFSTFSSVSRFHLAVMALRYALDHPFGTGKYAPSSSYASEKLISEYPRAIFLPLNDPHNQFLHVLVLYGFPGMGLLLLVYFWTMKSLGRTLKFAINHGQRKLCFLATGMTGGLASYIIITLSVGVGPFTSDWGHFFLIGLVFSIERITRQSPACVHFAATHGRNSNLDEHIP